MSTIWYECKIKYRKTDETGGQKITTEPYLVDALSYTEAEKRINEEMAAYISEEFKITNIKVGNYAEIHPFENADRWFKSKVSLLAFDEESGKERKSNMYLLVQANDVREAFFFLSLSDLPSAIKSSGILNQIKIANRIVIVPLKIIATLTKKRLKTLFV